MLPILRKLTFRSYQNCVKQSRRQLFGLVKSYEQILEKRPYLVQAVQSSILMGAGDLVAQTLFSNKTNEVSDTSDIDYIRTLKFGSTGFFLTGPLFRFWYGFLHRNIKVKTPLLRTLVKVGIDQILFVPIFLIIFISTINVLQNQNVEYVERKLRAQYGDILISNYYVWPWVQIVNFGLMPLKYQALVTSTVAFLWNTYVSWKTNKSV